MCCFVHLEQVERAMYLHLDASASYVVELEVQSMPESVRSVNPKLYFWWRVKVNIYN